jgi:DNA/RNA endonuclease G (NUC1)
MKKYLLGIIVALLIGSGVYMGVRTEAQQADVMTYQPPVSDAPEVSPNLVISQFQPGTSANPNDEFVEIHNISSSAVDLNGYRLVYRSQNGTNDVGPFAVWTTSTILQPGQFYLVASASYSGSTTPDVTYNPTTCSCSMSASNGGLAIRQGEMNTGIVIDAVGWGTGSNAFVENTRTAAPGSGSSKARLQTGCQDTDNNLNDFATLTPYAPRNTSVLFSCSGGTASLFASMVATPSIVLPSGTVLLTVNVQPATNPQSTGISVTGNLTPIGGAASQPFYDNGTNGDVTPGDNVFSYTVTIPSGQTGGTYNLAAVVTDAQSRAANTSTNLTVSAALANEDPLLFGNPTYATAAVTNENNYLMVKPQYTLSYNRSRNEANWVAWRLDTSWIGTTGRVGDFAPDTTLPAEWYQVTPDDYTDPRFDRGHMTPSGDRTTTFENNQATFLMTNILPQLSANNQGPWADLEVYSRTLAQGGNELYIISGGVGNIGTVGATANRVVIPEFTWKVVLVLPNGTDDLRRVTRTTRVFGVIMSNVPGTISQSATWRNFRVTVDQVEALTGYNFFSEIPINTQAYLERKRDTQ